MAQFKASLPTEVADQDGFLRRVSRSTTVRLYQVQADEKAMLYELGIPVVETGDRWHYAVGATIR